MAAAAFPTAFLIFMIPMPDAMADSLETGSKLAAAEAANLFFKMSGTPILRDGNIFQLPKHRHRRCSGTQRDQVELGAFHHQFYWGRICF